jgi:hypothetical protein
MSDRILDNQISKRIDDNQAGIFNFFLLSRKIEVLFTETLDRTLPTVGSHFTNLAQ